MGVGEVGGGRYWPAGNGVCMSELEQAYLYLCSCLSLLVNLVFTD